MDTILKIISAVKTIEGEAEGPGCACAVCPPRLPAGREREARAPRREGFPQRRSCEPTGGVDFGSSWKTASVSQACRHHLLSVWRDPRAVSILLLELWQVGTAFSPSLQNPSHATRICNGAQQPRDGFASYKCQSTREENLSLLLTTNFLTHSLCSLIRFYPEMLWDFYVLRHCQGDSQRPWSWRPQMANKGYLAFNTTDGTLFHFDLPILWFCNLIAGGGGLGRASRQQRRRAAVLNKSQAEQTEPRVFCPETRVDIPKAAKETTEKEAEI
ncbi:Valine--Trna Ligase [Manis pentadactyla]|nr:Valine--Trna Ligase [Manis pentadactyla]